MDLFTDHLAKPSTPDDLIKQVWAVGWKLIPQVATGVSEKALVWYGDTYHDIVTVPEFGYSTVVRLLAEFDEQHPRSTIERWRYQVRLLDALEWALRDNHDERALARRAGT